MSEFECAIKKITNDIKNSTIAMSLVSSTPDEDELVTLWHSNYGRFIRNSMGLWQDSKLKSEMESMGFTHADDMSSTLILCALRDIKGLPRKLEDQIQYYKEYWDQYNDKNNGNI